MNPLEKLAAQWEAQATRLDELDAAVPGGTITATIRADLLRENAAELREAIRRMSNPVLPHVD